MTDLILYNGKITTLDRTQPEVSALAISAGRIDELGSDAEILGAAAPGTNRIDLKGRRAIPGLNDSHTHLIRGGLSFNMELRWEGIPSLADALARLKQQAQRTPPPQWVRVVGGWSEFQFAERRMPTLKEINTAAPETPVFILHLYGRALLNRAALHALGFNRDTPDPPGGVIERDPSGNPTGLLLAKPSALILYSTLGQAPALPLADQLNSTRHYMREMNRLGITSVIDAGGGGQNYPQDYEVIQQLHDRDELTVRIAYNLFAQKAGTELSDYERWVAMTEPGAGDAYLRMNGAGENLVWSAADFENFLQPRPDLRPAMEDELEKVVSLLADNAWPFRIHATYDESIERFLTVFERVHGRQPLQTRFIIDHAETISVRNIERIQALGGGIAIQHRMAFQGEYFVERYGATAAEATPPVAAMLERGVPVGAGTDATRVASYDPWVSLYWLVSGKTLGGLTLYPESRRLDRETALYLWTAGSAWFSGEQRVKGRLSPGSYADLAVLSDDYFGVATEDIRSIVSVLTLVDGRIVYAADDYSSLSPPPLPVSPDWSPAGLRGGTYRQTDAQAHRTDLHHACALHSHRSGAPARPTAADAFWGAHGCSCFVF
ncbi:amidohydrolase [Exilibacterium tricleocarpae]|uniref:Amidohydrolase n=1 Tax=Exilibacterium tricleocarpae TaxID=2591008 RepID=A0A545UBE3_9GAMM|nr:amidohydrolase [Exilibacterium tricleocarpae]TQV86789.1 amidohydrolase [Exilibacterium tricleocarpae]